MAGREGGGMTARILNRWAALIRKAAREGWEPTRLDAKMAQVRR